MNNIFSYRNIFPQIDPSSFIAPTASIIGQVEIGKYSNIWFNTVIRGDVAPIKIGTHSNIQDGTIIHVSRGQEGQTIIGNYVTIGHKAMIHACRIEDFSFIGMNATIMDRAVIETGSWVAAGSLITEGKIVKKGEIWAGHPAKFFRKLTPLEEEHIKISAENYIKLSLEYQHLK